MKKSSSTKTKRHVHFLDKNGMVLCNPRDKEAANRAQDEEMGVEDITKVTCKKCIARFYKLGNRPGKLSTDS